MKRALIAFLLGLCAMAQSAEPTPESWNGNYLSTFELPRGLRVESFATLLASSVPSRSIAEDAALQYWHGSHGLLAEESLRATGLFRVGRVIKDFAAPGEWIWEVRVTHLGLSVDGVVWINAHTGKVRAFGPGA